MNREEVAQRLDAATVDLLVDGRTTLEYGEVEVDVELTPLGVEIVAIRGG